MSKNYKINFTTKTITITKSFCKLAQDPMSEEYNILMTFRKDFPEYTILTSAPKARKTHRKITYDKMLKYIDCQKDSNILLKRFAEVRILSKSFESPYNFVYKWFMETFPTYSELPEFDENGKIIPKYNLPAASPTLEEVSKAA